MELAREWWMREGVCGRWPSCPATQDGENDANSVIRANVPAVVTKIIPQGSGEWLLVAN